MSLGPEALEAGPAFLLGRHPAQLATVLRKSLRCAVRTSAPECARVLHNRRKIAPSVLGTVVAEGSHREEVFRMFHVARSFRVRGWLTIGGLCLACGGSPADENGATPQGSETPGVGGGGGTSSIDPSELSPSSGPKAELCNNGLDDDQNDL